MTTHRHTLNQQISVFVFGISVLAAGFMLAEVPAPEKVSAFAPIDDLTGQVDYYVESLERSVDVPADQYTEANQDTVSKSAATLAALAMLVSNHDQESPLKSAAPAIFVAARALGAEAKDLQTAKDRVAAIKRTVTAGGGAGGEPLKWQTAGDLEDLMKQVSAINSRLKRGVSSRSLKRYADRTTGYAVTMAAIAQAAMADDSYVGDETEMKQWVQYCIDMRDAAGAVNAAIHQQDEAKVEAAMTMFKKSCDDCHKAFEIDEET